MLKKEDLLDIIIEILCRREAGAMVMPRAAQAAETRKPATPAKKVFLSDWELRRLRTPGAKTIRVPSGTMISPLSKDWLDYDNIEIIYGDGKQ